MFIFGLLMSKKIKGLLLRVLARHENGEAKQELILTSTYSVCCMLQGCYWVLGYSSEKGR